MAIHDAADVPKSPSRGGGGGAETGGVGFEEVEFVGWILVDGAAEEGQEDEEDGSCDEDEGDEGEGGPFVGFIDVSGNSLLGVIATVGSWRVGALEEAEGYVSEVKRAIERDEHLED
ncbi:MAG: hypothetical protein Q9228_007728 [Teloschistes exilis]